MSKKTVLLVDDDEVFVEATTAILESVYEVRTASNGQEAHEAIARERPDVVVLDVMMDHLSEGFDVARKLKGDVATRHIPVVMLTGVDQVYDYRMEMDESFFPHDRFLEKPVTPEKLLQVLKEICAGDDS
ncbi:two-component system response regulator [Candidatus Eisenbacteria bacterium]|uniref:Two-component system response regulator n=1 Tax=Eiseniibacteriota bacterium TaxID=2212470 RepID=A0ABV6YIX3_UNCEI